MGIVLEKVNFTWQWNWLSAGEENCPHGKEIGHYWVCFLKRSFGFHSAPNTHETFGVHSQAAITCLNHLIVNLAPHCYSRGQALALNAVIPTSVHASAKKKQVFWQSSGKKFDDCGMPPNLPRFQRFSFESIPMPDYYYCTNEILLLNKASPLFGVVAGLITLKGNQTWNWRSIMGAINRRLGLGVE